MDFIDKIMDGINNNKIEAGDYIGYMAELLKENIQLKETIKDKENKALYDYAIITQLKVEIIMLKEQLNKINTKMEN